MAECHPVGFQWVMEAKARGAKVIHVDPRFTRTSAVADMHVPLRAGSDIVFLGAIINYVLTAEKYFRDYVVNYTNAATILTEDFADTKTWTACSPAWTASTAATTSRPGATKVAICRPPRADATARVARTGVSSGRCGRRLAARRTAPAAPQRTPTRTGTRRSSTPDAYSRC